MILFSLLAFSSTATGNEIQFQVCDGKTYEGKLSSVDITPCPTQPCVFHKGTVVKATIKFTPNKTVTNGTLEMFGIIDRVPVKFPLPDSDACKDHGIECPLKAGTEYSLAITLEIKKIFPDVKLIAQMDFKVSDDNYVFCFQFPVEIE